MPNIPYPYELNWQLVTGSGSLTPICSLSKHSLSPSLTVYLFSRYGEADREEKKEKRTGIQLLVATFKHMKKPYQLLIIPLTFWSGVEQGFFGADFTAVSFV